jgi:hypothetical protein
MAPGFRRCFLPVSVFLAALLLACSGGSRARRDLVMPAGVEHGGLRLTVRFIEGGGELVAAVRSSGARQADDQPGGGHAPYVSVFAFEFVADDPRLLLAGLDTGGARLETDGPARPVYDPPGLRKAFPEAVYALDSYLALLRGGLLPGPLPNQLPEQGAAGGTNQPAWTAFRVYPVFLVRSGERVRGHFLVPRLPRDRVSGRLLVDAVAYREPWQAERIPLVIPFTQAIIPEKP